ncbi:MAG: DUF2268 domain-containing putative Zn-dependent protease [Chitinophagaceae bacterium]
MRRINFILLAVLAAMDITVGQTANQQKVFTEDIDNFWIAYDSVHSTTDSLQQLQIIQHLYIDKGTEGLKEFMKRRDYDAERWVDLIRKYPKFWNSIRQNTLSTKTKAPQIEKSITRFKTLYPELRDAKMYFTIGGLRSGGTTSGNLVLIGSEIATGTAATDVSEFPDKWLANVFKEQSPENLVSINIHEYVHTQQHGESNDLLAQAIMEGSCDFITELVINKPMKTNYIMFGLQHEEELKEAFRKEMFSTAYKRWLYNGSGGKTVADLGYFMGYRICKSYYNNSTDKKKAIKNIIELNYSDTAAVEAFLNKSHYYREPLDKQALKNAFIKKQPELVRMLPLNDEDSVVADTVKEFTLVFSMPMDTTAFSMNYEERGKEYYPIAGVAGFSKDKTSLVIKADMKPNHEYGFIVTDRSFKSEDGFPLLKDYPIRFKTK